MFSFHWNVYKKVGAMSAFLGRNPCPKALSDRGRSFRHRGCLATRRRL